MKSILYGTLAAVVIAIAAAVILNSLGLTTAETFSTSDVRL